MQTGNDFSLVDNTLQEEQTYWRSRMEGLADTAFLMPDREAGTEMLVCHYETTLDEILAQKILLAAKNNDALILAILLSGLFLLLRKTGKGKDRLVGVPIYMQEEDARFFNHLLLLRDTAAQDINFRELLSATRASLTEATKFQNYPYTNILSAHKLPTVVDTIVLLDTIHSVSYLDNISFNQLFRFGRKENRITLNIAYNGKRMFKDTVVRLASLYQAGLLAAFENAAAPVAQLNWLTIQQQNILLQNNQDTREFSGQTVLEKLRMHAAGEETALVTSEEQYSFKAMHERSDRLALYLVARGVQPNEPVAVLMEPSATFIISVLAILKAGGCYVPLDPKIPLQRKLFIVTDSAACFLLTDKSNIAEAVELMNGSNVIDVENEAVYKTPATESRLPVVVPSHGAYILYTSGSTGYPKGVRINHANLHNYISWACDTYIGDNKPVVPLFTSISFDLTITSIFLPLVSGGRLIIYPQQEHEPAIAKIIAAGEATLLKLTPSHLRMIRETGYWPKSLTTLVVGGELFDRQLALDIHQLAGGRVAIYNEYGPTEATVGCAIYKYDPEENKGKTVLIGKPAPNCQLFVLDAQLQPVPFGWEGEIYIGGKQLAAYMPSVKNAKESFIDHPFEPGTQLYKTGDSCIMYEDGNLECTGRLNTQLKLNGYRIEPGEIEARLSSYPGISSSLVILQQRVSGAACLAAFYIAAHSINEKMLVDHLAAFLPAYMIPVLFTRLESFPLTINGKVDVNALPQPGQETTTGTDREFTGKEIILKDILSVLLGEQVEAEDNFFKKGGDSIKIVQLAARLLKAGYKVSIKDIYNHPVVADLAQLIEPANALADQSRIEGAAALNPVQQWFFENYTRPDHYNQSLLLSSATALDVEALHRSFAALLDQHDALRMEVRYKETVPYLYNTSGETGQSPVMFVDLRDQQEPAAAMQEHAQAIQSSINIQAADLLKVALFRRTDGDRLLIVIHHLVTDGISWRVLLEDLNDAYTQALTGKKIMLPPKTASFAAWNNSLAPLISAGHLENDHAYWAALDCENTRQLPVDHAVENSLLKDKTNQSFIIDEELTNKLAPLMQGTYQAGINDFLLAGIAMAARQVFGINKLAIALEGHGRENIPDDLDLSRTVGWFTSIYPFILDIDQQEDAAGVIKKISDHAKAIPARGASYGMLKYSGGAYTAPAYRLTPRVSLNYLGGFDEDVKSEWFALASESSGNSVDGNNPMVYDLEIRAIKLNKQIQVNIFYNRFVFEENTIKGFKDAYFQTLQRIINDGDTDDMTSGRFVHHDLGAKEEALLVAAYDPADIYPLSPMQLGLYFHALANPESYYYNTFFSYKIKGQLNVERLNNAFDILLQRYPVLRSNFILQEQSTPVVLVAKKKAISFQQIDLRRQNSNEKERFLTAHRQELLKKPYDFTTDTLMRVSVIEVGNEEFEVIWCYHHILIDGWCLNVLWKDLLAIYYNLVKDQPLQLPPIAPYTDYIQWLQKQDFNLSRRFWMQYLQGRKGADNYIEQQPASLQAEAKKDRVVSCRPGTDIVEGLIQLARKENCTIYTVLQCAWGLLLSKESGANDILFGQVVSGRPNIPGIGEMVGLFINTIPKRLKIDETVMLTGLIRQVWQDEIACLDHQFCPLRDIVRTVSPDAALFDHVIVFENQYQLMNIGHEMAQLDFEIAVADSYDPNEYDLSVFIFLKNQELSFDIRYNACRYAPEKMQSIAESLHAILQWMADPDCGAIGDMFVSLLQVELKLPDILSL